VSTLGDFGWPAGVVGILAAVSAFADVNPAGDLSGAWRITAKIDGEDKHYDLVLIKTELTVDNGEGASTPYYIVQADGIAGMKVVGASIRKGSDGKRVIEWRRFTKANGVDGTRLDGEFNMILKVQGDTLILGGDSEEFEIARMTKLPL
jgi:hypothetical protein